MAKKEGASEKRRALLRGLRRKQLHLSTQELGQNQADRLNICYQQHTHDQRDDEGNHLFGNGLQANAGGAAGNKQVAAKGRCHLADCQVHADDHGKVNG